LLLANTVNVPAIMAIGPAIMPRLMTIGMGLPLVMVDPALRFVGAGTIAVRPVLMLDFPVLMNLLMIAVDLRIIAVPLLVILLHVLVVLLNLSLSRRCFVLRESGAGEHHQADDACG